MYIDIYIIYYRPDHKDKETVNALSEVGGGLSGSADGIDAVLAVLNTYIPQVLKCNKNICIFKLNTYSKAFIQILSLDEILTLYMQRQIKIIFISKSYKLQ